MNRAIVSLIVVVIVFLGLTSVSARSQNGAVVAPVTHRTDFRDLGHAPETLIISLRLNLMLRNIALYERVLKSQNDQRSSTYRRPIPDRAFMTYFAPSSNTYNALIAQVRMLGLKVVSTSANRATLIVSGPTVSINRIFLTDMHVVYQSGVGNRYANSRPAIMPQGWVGVLSSIDGFDNLALRPNPRSVPPVPILHTTTIADDGLYVGGAVPRPTVLRWLSYAVGNGAATPDKAVSDGDHCVNTCSMFYTDFARLHDSYEPYASFLLDGNFVECSGSGIGPAADDWVLHTTTLPCSAATRTNPKPGLHIYNGNYGNLAGVGADFLSFIQGTYMGCTGCNNPLWNLHDYMFQDTTSVDLLHNTQCCSSTYEFPDNSTYDNALYAFENSLVHVAALPWFTAGQSYLSFLNGFADGQSDVDTGNNRCSVCLLDFNSSSVAGGVCEFCMQTGPPTTKMHPMYAPYTVNTASDVINAGHAFDNFNEYNIGEFSSPYPQVGAAPEDRYMLYATYMLYYQPSNPKAAILGEDFDRHTVDRSSSFNGVFPEQALVGYGPAIALQPYLPDHGTSPKGFAGCTPNQGDSGGIAAYLIPNTCVQRADNLLYVGEYGQAYSSGSYPTNGLSNGPVAVGPIAFVVNLTDKPKTVPCSWITGLGQNYTQQTFQHEILIGTLANQDQDVLNGGDLNLQGSSFRCDVTIIPATKARFLGQ